MVDEYLMASCGFSLDKATKFSKRLTHLKSPEKPDAVLRFLKHQGFSEADIKTLVLWYPPLLSSSPETILEPNLRALRNIGLSSSTLTQIILASPSALQIDSAVPRITFWWDFFGGDEAALVKVCKHNKFLIGFDISKNIMPKISLLQSHGFSSHDIKRMVLSIPRFINNSVGLMEKLLERTKELGFHPESGMFVLGLQTVTGVTREKLQKKMEIFKSFGWSEEDFLSGLQKAPTMARLSEENLRAKMDFLLGEARCDHSYITANPWILLSSLEKTMRPRHHVLHLLKSKGLSSKGKGQGLYGVMNLSNIKFVEKYILLHKNVIPELHEAYLTARTSRS